MFLLQVFNPPDYNNPFSIKNHNEVLRCFAILGTQIYVFLLALITSLPPKSSLPLKRDSNTVMENKIFMMTITLM